MASIITNAGVFGRGEYLNANTASYCTVSSRLNVSSNSVIVSPGKPTIMSVVMLIGRRDCLIQPMRSRYCSRVYSRCIRFSVVVDPLCTGRCTWMRRGKAYAPDSRNLCNRGQQFGEAPLPFRIAIAVHVLAQQLNLRVAALRHPPRLGQHRGGRPAALLPARIRHHAVGAKLVASLDNGDVAAILIRARRKLGLEGLVGLPVIEARNALLAGFQPSQHLRQLAIGSRSRDQRDIRCPLEDRFAFLLRDAAQHPEALALFQQFLGVVQPVEDLLLRLVADRAGVIENEAGCLFRLYLRVALLLQRPDDLLRVMDIHLAAEGLKEERLFYRHI